MRPDVLWVIMQIGGWEERRDAAEESRVEQSAVLTECAMLCLCVCCRALSDCVYFPEGRFTSGSPGMNGELISPTETSQSLHIYSPPSQWPLPGQANNGTLVNCRWVWLKVRPYILGTSILQQKLSEIKEKHCIRQRPGGHFSWYIVHNSWVKYTSYRLLHNLTTVYVHAAESI